MEHPALHPDALDRLHAHYTGGCPGCRRCDLYPGVMEGEPDAVRAYVQHMRDTTGTAPRIADATSIVPGPAESGDSEAEAAFDPSEPRCLRCGSDKIIGNTRIDDYRDHGVNAALSIRLGSKHPDAWVFKEPVTAELRADVCGECGHVEVRVGDPARLWAAFLSMPEQHRP